MSSTPLFFDRVQETSLTTGTGAYTLAGAVTGYQSFAAVGNNNSCYYAAVAVDASGVPTGAWEIGIGTYTLVGTLLSRDSILASTNANAAVNWGAGTKQVFLCAPAAGRLAVANLPLSAATPGVYGGAALIPVVQVDSTGRIVAISEIAAAGGGNVNAGGTLTADAIVLGDGSTDVKTTATGTGVVTALGVNVGSDGAFITRGGNAGTPSAIVLTNATGLVTAGINNAQVTLAKIANAAANDKLLGSGNSGSGAAYTEISLGSGLTMTGTTLSASGSGGGVSVYPPLTAPPAAASFTGTNVGSSVVSDDGDKLLFTTPPNAGTDSIHVYTEATPGSTWVATACLTMDDQLAASSFWGILARENATGKIVTCNMEYSAAVFGFGFDVMEWTNATTFSAREAAVASKQWGSVIFLQIEMTATNLIYRYSYNGLQWKQIASTTITNFFTTAPDEIGFGGYAFNTHTVSFAIASWDVV